MTKTKINERQLLDMFAVLVIHLDLADNAKPKLRFSPFAKLYPYSFDVDDAVKHMANLTLNIELLVSTTVSYSIVPDLALSLLHKYFAAHLLHDPSTRTTSKLAQHVVVQVTPKGTAVVYNFCKRIGMRRDNMPKVVQSEFNSMRLFQFDRSSNTNKVLYSEYLIHILVGKMMGRKPNMWLANAKAEPVKIVMDAQPDHMFDSSLMFKEATHQCSAKSSPFHHKYFTNPESDSHIQYYESESGLRLIYDGEIETSEAPATTGYFFSGKVLVQWLLDCTTLHSTEEAMEMGQLMIRYGLVAPVEEQDISFSRDRSSFYYLRKAAEQSCCWNKDDSGSSSISLPRVKSRKADESEEKLLALILDPGMRYLFKLHLEKEKCAENIDAYLQLTEFVKLREQLAHLLRHHECAEEESRKEKLARAIDKVVNSNYSMAFHIYATYLSSDSPYDLNIDFGLRQEIGDVMSRVPGPYSSTEESYDADYDNAEYAKTPVLESFADEDERTLDPGKHADSGGEDANVSGTARSLFRIYRVFDKVARSIYRLMEADSYAKFIQSDEYMYAMGLETHRS